MAAARHSDDLIGNRYRLESTIASGGMADVWRATDLQLGRSVAVKLLRASVIDDPIVTERFRREARALAKLTHPNIVPVYDCVEEHGQVALIMRLIEGKSLRELLDEANDSDQAGMLSVHLTVHIGRAIAAALAKAHAENIVHRDIKPGNILIMEQGEVLLTDFGIAKPLKSSKEDGTDLTRVDIMMGTAKYLSPEQVQGRDLDGRADMYSLGLVLYECLAGHAPFKEDNDQATAVARLQRDPTPLSGIRSDVPSNVIAVVNKMLRRKPEHRYNDCNEVAQALESAIKNVHDAMTPADGFSPALSAPTTARPRPVLNDPLMPKKQPRVLSVVDTDDTPPRVVTKKDVTPRGVARAATALPRTQQTSTKRKYIPIAVLLVTALVMAFFLWRGLQSPQTLGTTVVDNVVVENVSVIGMRSYDPNGDNEENEAMIPNLTDNNPSTVWTTVCYGSQYFGSTAGVGVVVQLSGLGIGTLAATFRTAPWNAEVFVSPNETIPATIEGWGLRVADSYGATAGPATFSVATPGRNVLLLMREAGRSTSCSNNNPYKGILSDLSFASGK
jgi:eukaryotic-like serine/threonine-protein kinase